MAKNRVMVLSLVLACMVMVAPYAKAITCGEVATDLVSCLSYLQDGGAVPPGCCSGIIALNNAATTTRDRQTVCGCLKSLYSSYGSGIQVGLAAGLPAKCGVNVPYKISPDTDCSKIQ